MFGLINERPFKPTFFKLGLAPIGIESRTFGLTIRVQDGKSVHLSFLLLRNKLLEFLSVKNAQKCAPCTGYDKICECERGWHVVSGEMYSC